MLDNFDRIFLWANRTTVASMLLVMSILVFANVALRYIFGISLPWVEEITRYMMIWVAWLSVGLASREGAHIAIENFQNAVPPAFGRVLRILSFSLTVVFFVLVAWFGWKYAMFTWMQESAVLRLPLGGVYLSIPIGCVITLVHILLMSKKLVSAQASADEQVQAAEYSVI